MSRAYPNQQTTKKRIADAAQQAGLAVHDFLLARFTACGRSWAALSAEVGISESSLRRFARTSPMRGCM